ncbi:MAG TPA: TetR/AcrR family transcriptional regulator, partial [Geobacteraceae bacterium]|nr:TetR/AcrR family transcriptional regulator [Geobacteraceae bacterium]
SRVAKATFYSNFSSKEALCVAYLQARHTLWMGWLKQRVEKEKNARKRLLAVFDFLRSWMTESGYRGCAFLNIASEVPAVGTEIRSEVIKHKDDLRKYLHGIILEVIGPDAASTGLDARKTAKMVYVMVEGAIVASQNYNEIWPVETAREAVKRLMGL